MNVISAALGQFGLKVLERLMHKSKLLSLKFHNVANEGFHSIREKRQHRMRMQLQEKQERREAAANEISTRTKTQSINPLEYSQEIQSKVMSDPRPMIKSTVTRPEPKRTLVGSKDKLEAVLIRRIALNPRDIEAYERLGDYYMESENHRDALECFKQVLRLSPVHHKAKLRIRRIERMMQ